MNCNQKDCPNTATHIVYWPGKSPPPRMCEEHANMAIAVASAMGLTLHIEKREEE